MTAPHRTRSDPGTTAAVPGEDQRVSPWFLANVLLRRRRLIIVSALACAVAVAGLSRLPLRKYVASATFVPEQPRTPQSLLNQLAPQFGLTLGQSTLSSPEFYATLLQSKELQRDVLTSEYLVQGDGPFHGNLIQYLKIDEPDQERAVTLAIRALNGMVSITTDRSTGLVSLQVTTTNADLSEQIATRFLDLVNEYNLRRQQSQAKAEREFLEQRLGDARDSMSAAEDVLARFLARNRRYSDSPELTAEASRLERQANLRQQLYLSLNQYYEQAKVEEVRNTPLITVIQHPQGFVERKPRGTVVKALWAFVVGAFAAVFVAFARERVNRLQGLESQDYAEFQAGLSQLVSRLRILSLRRANKRVTK